MLAGFFLFNRRAATEPSAATAEKPMKITDCRLLPIALATLGLSRFAGCDSGGKPSFPSSSAPARLSGHVFNDDGPVNDASIEVRDARDQVIVRSELKGSSRYSLTLPAGASFPLIVKAQQPNSDEAPLKAAVTSGLTSEQDISPVTTIVVDTALSLGGLTEANLAKAAGAAIAQRKKSGGGGGGGATTQSFKGDPTKQFGGWH